MPKTESVPTLVHDATQAATEIGKAAWDSARDMASEAASAIGSTGAQAAHLIGVTGTQAAHTAAEKAAAGVHSVRRAAHGIAPERRKRSRAMPRAVMIGALAAAVVAFVAVIRRRCRHGAEFDDAAEPMTQAGTGPETKGSHKKGGETNGSVKKAESGSRRHLAAS